MKLAIIPTTPEGWLEKTCLLLEVRVGIVLSQTPHALTLDQIDWFQRHVDERFRYLHANNMKWRRWTEGRTRLDPRLQADVWIRHWLSAYVIDPERYQRRHANNG